MGSEIMTEGDGVNVDLLHDYSELKALLQSAKLTGYFSNFVEQGGDDVKQLCDASKEEFDEIVRLVGMSSKPLHARRLAKALATSQCDNEGKATSSVQQRALPSLPLQTVANAATPSVPAVGSKRAGDAILSDAAHTPPHKRAAKFIFPAEIPSLLDLGRLDDFRRKIIRESSKIYGRDEKKRRTKLTSNEEYINEASFELCLRDPTLLVRRDVLFGMARKVVRESGLTVTNGGLRSSVKRTTDEQTSCDDSQLDLRVPPLIKIRDAQTACSPDSPLPCASLQPEVNDVDNDYDVIMCYKLHNRWPRGVRKSRKSHLRRKARRIDLVDGALFYLGLNDKIPRAWLVSKDDQKKLIEMLHVDSSGKHFGRDKTNTRVASSYFWKGIADDVASYVRACPSCRANADRYRAFLVTSTNEAGATNDRRTQLNSLLNTNEKAIPIVPVVCPQDNIDRLQATADLGGNEPPVSAVPLIEVDRTANHSLYDAQLMFSERQEVVSHVTAQHR